MKVIIQVKLHVFSKKPKDEVHHGSLSNNSWAKSFP